MTIECSKKGRVYVVEFYDFETIDPYEVNPVFASTNKNKLITEILSYVKRELNAGFENTRDSRSPHII